MASSILDLFAAGATPREGPTPDLRMVSSILERIAAARNTA